MASPHVAGSVALLISLEPKLAGQIDQLEELLRKTAVQLTSAQTCGGVPGSQIPNNAFGWGRIDVKAAADMVYHAGYIQGTVTVGGVPTAGVPVTYSMLGKTLTTKTDASGFYKVIAGAGTWAMTATLFGQTINAPAVVVVQNGTTVQDFAIPAITSHTVSGTVTQSGTGTGVPAMIMVANQDLLAPVWAAATDAAGDYSIVVPAGTWDIVASHPGYQPATQNVVVGGNTTLNFQLTPQPTTPAWTTPSRAGRRTPGSTLPMARPTHWATMPARRRSPCPGPSPTSAPTTRPCASTRTATYGSAPRATLPPT